jgi:hypothetical protein
MNCQGLPLLSWVNLFQALSSLQQNRQTYAEARSCNLPKIENLGKLHFKNPLHAITAVYSWGGVRGGDF